MRRPSATAANWPIAREMKAKKASKRLKLITEAFSRAANKPEWMILTVVPVIRSCVRWCCWTEAAHETRKRFTIKCEKNSNT
jgi:DNA-directed RNA polymerase beta' subunit